ncbi:ABC transporter substrate-binding protein [Bosea sp. NBC_00550]|uniref:ABC transporter substrate-binding protein n=1 Tax=Bosea sp. NBC_00550 TaxID=2969621 RepID=UPI0022311BCD|nr:ABC transporter substrate-binding protein [Bosea sp. NBC_00550]UZF91415.1 ABC transporter substrate-binding protein [Bosea sp. NBC_00550]
MTIDRRTLLLAGLALPVLSARASEPVTATDVLGRTVRLAAPARRIVLAQGRQLNALGLLHPDPVSLLAGWGNDLERQNADALARYRARFPAIDALPIVGDGGTANGFSLERAIALGPDLVVLSRSLAGTRRGPGDLVEKLEGAGIPVVVVDFFLEPLRDTVPSLRALGRLIGRDEQADKLIAFYEERMQRVASRVAGATRPSVFVHAHAGGYDCCMTAGQGTFNEFVHAAGGRNIAAAMLPGATGQIGLEQLISADPDVYVATGGTHLAKLGGLVLGLGIGEADAEASFAKLLATPSLSTLTAIEKRRAFGFWHLFNDTPLHVVAIEALAKWLHPERFRDIDPAATLAEGARFSAIPLDGTLWIAAPAAGKP